LSDGRLMVSDWIEERVVLLDFASGGAQGVGRSGGGPREFRAPGGLIAFRSDSTLIVDVGNVRLAVVGPDGLISRTIRGDVPGLMGVGGADGQGRLYYVEPGWAAGVAPDSRAPRRLLAYDPATGRTDLIELLDVARPRSDAGEPRMTPGIPFQVFAGRDGWAVAPDGAVAIARWEPFRVEWLADGKRSTGPPVESTPIPVTARDRETFVRRFVESSPVSGRGPGGGMGQSPPMSDTDVREMVASNDFAEVHAPFDPGSLRIAADGRLWLQASPATRAPVRLDVFGTDGAHEGTVMLPDDVELLHVGRDYLYATRKDSLGLQSIVRCTVATRD